MTRAATLASGTPVALDTNGTVRLARGLASITKTWVPPPAGPPSCLTANCTLSGPMTSRAAAIAPGVVLDHPDRRRVERRRRDHAGAVAGVHAGLLDVLHDRADDHLAGRVAHRVDVDLDGVLQEAVDQHRALRRQAAFAAQRAEAGQLVHGPAQVVLVVDDLHGPPAEHVARPHQGRDNRPGPRWPGPPRSWRPCRPPAGGSPAGRTGRSSAPGPRPGRWSPGRCRAPARRQQAGQLQRRLAAEGHDDAGHRPGADSTSMTLVTSSQVTGSKYRRSLVS